MDNSDRLSLPYILPSQAQKHVTHNEAIKSLDILIQLSTKSIRQSEEQISPVNGDCYLIDENASGSWTGKQKQIAAFQNGTWVFYEAREGWVCWVEDLRKSYRFTQDNWQPNSTGSEAEILGINTAADTINRLSVKSDNILLSHDDITPGTGDTRLIINKADTRNNASMIFQSDYTAKAELGLSGNDNVTIQTTTDGLDWNTAISLDNATGHACFGNAVDLEKALTVTGNRPFLRISNVAENIAGIETVDAQASQQQNFKITYNCGNNIGTFEVDQKAVMQMNSNQMTANIPLHCEKILSAEHIYSSSRVFIANNHTAQDAPNLASPTEATNLDHIWNDEGSNTWHFCSDTSYKANGNATVRAAAFMTTSDYRLKKNVEEIDKNQSVNQLLNLRPINFNWSKGSGIKDDRKVSGFMAHEIQQYIPNAVKGEKDALDHDDDSLILQSIDFNQVLPIVISALQNALHRINDLEERVWLNE